MIHDVVVGFPQRVASAACMFLLFMSLVEGRNIVEIAKSCTDYRRLMYDPTATKIVVVGMIVMRDCVWGDKSIPKRELIITGEGNGGVLDYRGMKESAHFASGSILKLSDITVISDEITMEPHEWAYSRGEGVHVTMVQSVLRFSKCIEYMSKHPWLTGTKGSNNFGQGDNICGLENGGIMMNKVDFPASDGITSYIRETEIACDDLGAGSLKSFELKSCQKGGNSWKALSSSTALKVYGSLCIIVPFIFFVLFFYIMFFCLPRKRSTAPQDKLLSEAEAISSPHDNDDDGFLALEDVHLGAVIGKGGFSTVYHATLSDKQVAVKVFESKEPSTVEKKSCEVLVSSTVIHPNIVRCIAYRTCDWNKCPSGYGAANSCDEKDLLTSDVSDAFDFVEMASPSPGGNQTRTWLIMEYCNMGSMYTAIKNATFHECPDRTVPNLQRIIDAALDIAQAMQHLHAVGVIHGDLKSQNVLLQASDSDERGYVCKVCDFGFSRLAINSTHIQTFTCGSVRAMPPEVLKDGFLTPAADVYSFGILLWELLRGRPPYQGWGHQTILHNVVHGRRPRVPDEWPRGLASLVRDCLKQARTQRPSFSAIIACLRQIDVKQSVRAHDEPDCPINSELEDVFFSCSCCTEDHDTLQIPHTLGFDPRKLSGFVIDVASSENLDQDDGELCEKEGRNLWMSMNWC